MSGTIILGYDIESASESTGGFLRGATELHNRYDVPWTIYLTGRTVEACAEDILEVVEEPLLSIGQHTYGHALLKCVYMMPGDGEPVHGQSPNFFIGACSPDEVREEIGKAQAVIADRLGVECHGITGPWLYYRGLVDRPDLLQILRDNDLRWVRMWGRDSRDCQPTPFTVQPFFYADQGFPEILELGCQGYQDDFYWDRFDDRRYGETYEDYLLATLEQVAANDWVWNVDAHDHGTPTREAFFQTKGKWLENFITRARDLGIRFTSPVDFYEEAKQRLQDARP